MKSLLVVFGILAVVASVQCGEGAPEEVKKFFKECKEEMGITEEHMDKTDPKLKCVMACTMNKNGVMVDDKLVADKFWTKMKEYYPETEESLKEKITKCVEIANEKSDKCDVAGAFKMCAIENGVFPAHKD